MDTIKKVRKAYLEAEANERIKAARNRKSDSFDEPIPVGSQAMFYRDGKKGEKGWHGPGRIIDRDGADYTIKHGRNLISVDKRDIRNFRSSFEFEKDEKRSVNKNGNLMMRNERTNNEKQYLINEIGEKCVSTKCKLCETVTTCMLTLIKRTCQVQRNKPSISKEEIANNLFRHSYICPDCLFVNQRQLDINQFMSVGISDANLRGCVDIMDVTPMKKSRYEFKIRTGEVSKDVVKGFLITTQQYEFAVEQLNNIGSCNPQDLQRTANPNQSVDSSSETETTERNREDQDETESEVTETTELQDVNSTVSPLSNSGQVPDIDDVYRLLAEGRQMRSIERIKEEIRNENPFVPEREDRRAESSNQQVVAMQARQINGSQVEEADSENQSPARSPIRLTRTRKSTQHYGEVVPSHLKKFYVRGEDNPEALFTVTNVSMEEKVINREMLANSREEELKDGLNLK